MAELHLLSPAGFRAGAIYAGIKSKQAPDVGLLACDGLATAAAVFTTNKVVAAPVKVGREHIASSKLHAVVVNAANIGRKLVTRSILVGSHSAKPANDAHHWRRASGIQHATETESRRPVHEPD